MTEYLITEHEEKTDLIKKYIVNLNDVQYNSIKTFIDCFNTNKDPYVLDIDENYYTNEDVVRINGLNDHTMFKYVEYRKDKFMPNSIKSFFDLDKNNLL